MAYAVYVYTANLGTSTGAAAAKGAALIPVVGQAAAAGIALLDAVLPHKPFCNSRSGQLALQLYRLQQQKVTVAHSPLLSRALNEQSKILGQRIREYESRCQTQRAQQMVLQPETVTPQKPWYNRWQTYGLAAVGVAAAVWLLK